MDPELPMPSRDRFETDGIIEVFGILGSSIVTTPAVHDNQFDPVIPSV